MSSEFPSELHLNIQKFPCMYVHAFVYMYVCMYVFIYLFIKELLVHNFLFLNSVLCIDYCVDSSVAFSLLVN